MDIKECPNCGYDIGDKKECPYCGQQFSVNSTPVGDFFNKLFNTNSKTNNDGYKPQLPSEPVKVNKAPIIIFLMILLFIFLLPFILMVFAFSL